MLWYFCEPLQTGHALVCGEHNYSTGPLIVRLLGSNLRQTGTSVEYRLLQQRSISFVHVNEYRHTGLGCLCINYCYGRANMSQRCALAEKLIQTTPFSNIWCIRLIVLNENTQKFEHNLFHRSFFHGRWGRGGRVQLLVSQPAPRLEKCSVVPALFSIHWKPKQEFFPLV